MNIGQGDADFQFEKLCFCLALVQYSLTMTVRRHNRTSLYLAGDHSEWPDLHYYIICNIWALIKLGSKGLILGKILAINMLSLLLLNIYNNQ